MVNLKPFQYRIKRIVPLLLIAALLASLCGCGKVPASVSVAAGAEAITPKAVQTPLHLLAADRLEEIASSGLITLLFDEDTCAPAVKTQNGSTLWSALPQQAGDASANVVGVQVLHNGKCYALNSQDNAVAFGSVAFEKSDNGIRVVYVLSDSASHVSDALDGKATDAKAVSDGSLRIQITAEYELRDGCLYASLSWANLGSSADVVTNIGFLKYFGATDQAQPGDFLLIPDGSGAMIETAVEEELEPVDVAVYGNGYSGQTALSGVTAAFGQRQGDEAFAAVIQAGDAISVIQAAKAGETQAFHRVGADFAVTPCEAANGRLYYAPQAAYTDKITICYRFLNESNATYAGMAAVCREMLIRDHTLSTRTVQEQDDVPVMIQVIGSVERDNFLSLRKKLTAYSGAKDLLTRVKSKGVNNAYLRCTGFLTGGTDAENAANAKSVASMGGRKGLKELNEYANGQNFSIFLDLSIASSRAKSTAVRTPSGSLAAVEPGSSLARAGFSVKDRPDYLLAPGRYKKAVSKTLNRFRFLGGTGYCVADLGASLTGDYVAENRQSVADSTADLLAPLSVNSRVMVVGGNFYSLKNADVVSGLPMVCGHEETQCYTSVPFVPVLLHGIVDYCYDEINLQTDSKMALLHCIEYGAIPGYVLTDRSLVKSEEYDAVFSADNRLNEIWNAYTAVSGLFADLRAARITNHYAVQNGVYCTEYESTTKVYVNYTDEAVSIGGVKVEPMGYFRVN